jgi:hypothetical protein
MTKVREFREAGRIPRQNISIEAIAECPAMTL